ncbi:MAG TPA: hypothetical protein DDX84_07555 [Nitrospiraceae bacterium]|nr:MAG: hypothetical protein A3D21_01385 [Nitrospirae bacterium RIFCSPHIGHO2_02_FULL_42_12]HAS17210.1 hypothetical protein [Nitrospiraceae bacterium]HBI24039.1 hypothetical protein [Nitrospiraceae bacterium]
MRLRKSLLYSAAALILVIQNQNIVLAEELNIGYEKMVSEEAVDHFSYLFRTVGFINMQYPGDSTQNPRNGFLKLYRYSYEINLRPDFFMTFPHLKGILKPRLNSYYRTWEDGVFKGESGDRTEGFINEWRLQGELTPSFFLSYGKEKLLWGSSLFVNPSNPFFKDNEKKSNSKIELKGKYFLRLVYIPNNAMTISLIDNARKGDDIDANGEFKRTYAVKMDVTGRDYLIGLIGSIKETESSRLGSYGQWTLSDPLILYYDATAARGTNALYPEPSVGNPLGYEFVEKYKGKNSIFATGLAGVSYTLLDGSTFNLEYLRNTPGYNSDEANRYLLLRQRASGHFFDNNTPSSISAKTLLEANDPGLLFLRKNYAMVQYMEKEIKDVLDIILRYTHNLDDDSGSLVLVLECGVSDSAMLFNINNINMGGQNADFRSIVDKSFMFGVEYTY